MFFILITENNMRYRKACFKDLPANDLAKLTYLEWLVNDVTETFDVVLTQDVMRMTTFDWLRFPVEMLGILIMPLISFSNMQDARKHAQKSCPMGYVTYSEFTIYWRNTSDFSVAPYRCSKT